MRARQSSEDVYFSKSGEMQPPSLPSPQPDRPPSLCGGDADGQGTPRVLGVGPRAFLGISKGLSQTSHHAPQPGPCLLKSPVRLPSPPPEGPLPKLSVIPPLLFLCRTTEAPEDICGPSHI